MRALEKLGSCRIVCVPGELDFRVAESLWRTAESASVYRGVNINAYIGHKLDWLVGLYLDGVGSRGIGRCIVKYCIIWHVSMR